MTTQKKLMRHRLFMVKPRSPQAEGTFPREMKKINEDVTSMKQLEHQVVIRRMGQIQEELKQGVKKPYQEIINISWGNPHGSGTRPLTFVRQVLSACLYSPLLDRDQLPEDVRLRARRMLQECSGESVGCYTATAGIPEIVHRVSEFLTRRDGGVRSLPQNIYITAGSQWALGNVLKLLVDNTSSTRTGVLAPVPCHNKTLLSIIEVGGAVVPYQLSEEQGWELQLDELRRALRSAKGPCRPRALYVINPGNPSGHVQSRKSIQEVIRFASEERLFLLADEVYQDFVYGERSEFVSYRKVLAEMGPPLSDSVELASFHSASKGFMGECGLRGGFVELVNLDESVIPYVYTRFSMDSCSPVLGQMALDLMATPPQPGDASFALYNAETGRIRSTLFNNVNTVVPALNRLPGFCCQPVQGGLFAFPRLHLPLKAVQKAKEMGLEPDTFYCLRLLEEAGLVVSPGCDFGQKDGTYHIRFFLMISKIMMEETLRRLRNFHLQFMEDFS